MDLNGIPLFSLMTNRMSWLSSRQSMLAQNVANSDTPGYVARDIKPANFQSMLPSTSMGSSLLTTNARHLHIGTGGSSPFQEENAFGEGGTPTGNVVSLEQEMIKLSDTHIQYQTVTNLYQKAVNMFRTALGGRSS